MMSIDMLRVAGLGLVTAAAIVLPFGAEAIGPAASCDLAAIAGRWINPAPVQGSDVTAAEILVDCDTRKGLAVTVALTVRCLRYDCRLEAEPAVVERDQADNAPSLLAVFAEERVERTAVMHAVPDGRLRLVLTTRFRNVPLDPVQTTYLMERPGW